MNKTAIKDFAIWARRKLIEDVKQKAKSIGIDEKNISSKLEISTDKIEFYDIGTVNPVSISGFEIKQRQLLIEEIKKLEKNSDYKTAFKTVIEEVAYTWFNRLISIRFMEANDYLPSGVRVISSELSGKREPDMVTNPFDTDLDFSETDIEKINILKDENKLDELFRMLFIKQCNKLNEVLPELFEKTNHYTELLLNISFTDKDGIVSNLINTIDEEDFKEEVEIVGWLYQYYNTELKEEIKINSEKISREHIPAVTQLFTPSWIVRYMVDNTLGRYWVERNQNSKLIEKLEFFVKSKKEEIKYIDEKINPEDLTFFDPCMGSGHILVYAFEVLLEIYRECGYRDRDSAKIILENNIYGLDIDKRAYQLAYFALMMKGRKYDRRFLTREVKLKVHPIYEYSKIQTIDNKDINYLIEEFSQAKQNGSLINLKSDFSLENIKNYIDNIEEQISMDSINTAEMKNIILNIEIMLGKYSVVCTNPPYLNTKKFNDNLRKYVKIHYEDYKEDLYSIFIFKMFDYCKINGYLGLMTSNTWLTTISYEKLRKFIFNEKLLITLIEMAKGSFNEAGVDITSFVLKNSMEKSKGLYIKLSDFKGGMEVQKEKTLEAIREESPKYFFETSLENISEIPGSPIAYGASEKTIENYKKGQLFDDVAKPRQGMATGCNDIFLRDWFEVDNFKISFTSKSEEEAEESTKKWFPYNKGGGFRRWYGKREKIVNYEKNGFEIKNFKDKNGKLRSRPQNKEFYFKEGITWSDVNSTFAGRYIENGFIFDVKGSSCFPNISNIYYTLGLINSMVFQTYIKILNSTSTKQVGSISKVPFIFSDKYKNIIDKLVEKNISISKTDWDSFETSWNFKKHPFIEFKNEDKNTTISRAFEKWKDFTEEQFNELKKNEEELNCIFIEIYGLEDELTPEVEDKDVTIRKADFTRDIKSFISYSIGCILGRYSLDIDGLAYAGGDWNSENYKTFIPVKDNCLVITDKEYLENDIVSLFIDFVKIVYGEETLEENLSFIAKGLTDKNENPREVIRKYFLKGFFEDHVKTYKKRPIYWLYNSGKENGFKALIYLHRYTPDTTGIVRTDYLHKVQEAYKNEIDRLNNEIDYNNDSREKAKAEKEKEKLLKQLKETKDYDVKIAHIAISRIEIDLDDGVKANYKKVQTDRENNELDILAKF